MKIAWKLLVAAGTLLIAIAFGMDTTVNTAMGSVHNIGLQSQQQMILILGCVLFLAGIILFGVMTIKQTPEEAEEERAKQVREETLRKEKYQTIAAEFADALRAPKPDQPRGAPSPLHEHLEPAECIRRMLGLGYRVRNWLGFFWTINGKRAVIPS